MTRPVLLLVFLLLLLSFSVDAQLHRGDRLLGFGQHVAFGNVAQTTPLSTGLLTIGDASGTNYNSPLLAIPNMSWMLTDGLQLGTGMVYGGNLDPSYSEQFGFNLGLRAYLSNGPRGGMYVGSDYVYLSGQQLQGEKYSVIYPNGGLTVNLGQNVQIANELGFLVGNKDFPNQLLFSVQMNFLLQKEPSENEDWKPAYGRGSIMLGTSGLSFSRLTALDITQLLISPEAHYFISPTTAAGLKLRYQRVPSNDAWDGPATALGAGISLRQFIAPPRHTFMPFAQVGVNYNNLTANYRYYGYYSDFYTVKSNYFSYDAAVGGLIFVKPTIALEMGVGFSAIRGKRDTYPSRERSLAFTLGGRYVLPTRNG